MLTCQSHLFSIPENITYLNCAYMSPSAKPVEAAGIAGLQRKSKPWEVGVSDFFEPVEELKKLFAQLINTSDANRIAIIPSASYGIASVVKNIDAKSGQNVVLLEEQFPSNVYAWQRLATESGCELRFAKAPDTSENRGQKWNEKLLDQIDENTAAVALPHIHWADGTLFDLKTIRQKATQVGAKLIIDGTQSVGALPFDIAAIQPDALVCAGYKWLLGPYSFGLAYYAPSFDSGTPIEENWINRLNSENFQQLVNYQPRYKVGSNRFNAGELSNFIAVPMMTEALRLLLKWQPANIQAYCKSISKNAIETMQDKGIWLENTDWRSEHLLGIRLPENMDLEGIKRRAVEANIYVSFRGNAIRIAPHLYNTVEDFDRLVGLF